MMTLLVAALMWQEATPGPFVDGLATFYAKGVTEQVAHNRGLSLEGTAGGVVLNRAGDLSRRVWIEYQGVIYGGENGFLVIDCAKRGRDYAERERKGLVVEVSWEQAQEWGMTRSINVRVLFQKPYADPPGAI